MYGLLVCGVLWGNYVLGIFGSVILPFVPSVGCQFVMGHCGDVLNQVWFLLQYCELSIGWRYWHVVLAVWPSCTEICGSMLWSYALLRSGDMLSYVLGVCVFMCLIFVFLLLLWVDTLELSRQSCSTFQFVLLGVCGSFFSGCGPNQGLFLLFRSSLKDSRGTLQLFFKQFFLIVTAGTLLYDDWGVFTQGGYLVALVILVLCFVGTKELRQSRLLLYFWC